MVSAQGARVESAEHSVDDAQISLSAAVGLTYFELRGAQRQLAVALRALFERFPGVSLAVAPERLEPIESFIVNGHSELPVLLG